jgi:hypothetical protein
VLELTHLRLPVRRVAGHPRWRCPRA